MGIRIELVLMVVSFGIHVILFFAGIFQMRCSDKLIRSVIGLAYLGANFVAATALGNLLRQDQDGSANSMAFLWAPFLLVHLGGNDTITAWTLEDNNLWLRSWCNLVLHVGTAGYAFWKSIGIHSVELLFSGIFVFVTGTIKYGEKAWCLKAGSIESLVNSTGRHHYEIQAGNIENGYRQVPGNNRSYSDIINEALRSMCDVHDVFAARSLSTNSVDEFDKAAEIIQSTEEGAEERLAPPNNLASLDLNAGSARTESGDANVFPARTLSTNSEYEFDTAREITEEHNTVLNRIIFTDTSSQSTEIRRRREGGAERHLAPHNNLASLDLNAGSARAESGDANAVQPSGVEADAVHVTISGEALHRDKVVELELGMMRDDLYTKACVLRTRAGVVLRLISVISAIVGFGLFVSSNKQRYHKVDIAISYSLFTGVFLLEFCSLVVLMMSPWTWAWFKSKNLSIPEQVSWFLLSSRIGWPEARPRWSTSMGQCNIMHMLVGMYEPRSWTPIAVVLCRRLLNVFGFGNEEEPFSYLSNLIHTEYVTVDNRVMHHVLRGLDNLSDELMFAFMELFRRRRKDAQSSAGGLTMATAFDVVARQWPHLEDFLSFIQDTFIEDFGTALLMLHIVTDVWISGYAEATADSEVCRRLSNYMMYLLVNHPSSLPLNTSAVFSLEKAKANFSRQISGDITSHEKYDNIKAALLGRTDQPTSPSVLTELIDMWTRVLLFAAGRTKAEHHAAHLARGGELITTTWLHMANRGYGDSKFKRIRINNYVPIARDDLKLREVYALYFRRPPPTPPPSSSGSDPNLA